MSFFFKNPQSYFSYLTQIWHFSILPNGEIFNFFIKFWRTYDTSIKMFCEMAKKPPKSNGIFLILPLVRNPSTSERERVLYCLFIYMYLKSDILFLVFHVVCGLHYDIHPLRTRTSSGMCRSSRSLVSVFIRSLLRFSPYVDHEL